MLAGGGYYLTYNKVLNFFVIGKKKKKKKKKNSVPKLKNTRQNKLYRNTSYINYREIVFNNKLILVDSST